jgi:kinetochore protein Spc7/SPC105
MRYKREVELVFDIASLQKQQQNTSFVSLRYVAESPSQGPPEKEFFLHHIREHLRSQPKSNKPTQPSRLLHMVSSAWNKASAVSEHIRRLNLSFPTSVVRTSEGRVSVTASVLLVPLQTRVEVILGLEMERRGEGMEVVVSPDARVVYGESFNVSKMIEFLKGRVWGGGTEGEGKVGWDEAVLELYKRLLVKGRQRQ